MQRAPTRISVPAVLAGLLAAGTAGADTWTLRALEDFPTTDAGDVPYYRDAARDALAIDAAVLAYRDRFARATAPHPGPGGTFDLVLTTLAEVDGETTYHLLVDGNRVGTATNPRVPDEFSVQTHAFDDIEVPDGATIGIESAAVSNGLVPENGEFAFARGRWRSLSITTSEPEQPDPASVELSVSLSGPERDVRVGDPVIVEATVVNASAATVATAPELLVELPDGLGFVSGEGCTSEDGVLNCALAELASDASVALSLELEAVAEGEATLVASISADQPDGSPENDRVELDIAVRSEPVAVVAPIEVEADSEEETVEEETESSDNEGVGSEGATSSGDGDGGGAAWSMLLLIAFTRIVRSNGSRSGCAEGVR